MKESFEAIVNTRKEYAKERRIMKMKEMEKRAMTELRKVATEERRAATEESLAAAEKLKVAAEEQKVDDKKEENLIFHGHKWF